VTHVVPFDGSELSTAALVRAAEFAEVFGEEVLAVSVLPEGNVEYATARGWIDSGEPFDTDRIVSFLREQVAASAPAATFRHELVERRVPERTVGKRVREVARSVDASIVFIGSENAGRLVTRLTSVGTSIASDTSYDVVIVRHPDTNEQRSEDASLDS
jgi:nucleotide-binding universal stress UspA family protein